MENKKEKRGRKVEPDPVVHIQVYIKKSKINKKGGVEAAKALIHRVFNS